MPYATDQFWRHWHNIHNPKPPQNTISPALVFSRLITESPRFETRGDDSGDYYYLFDQATIFCWSFFSNQVIKLFAIYTLPEHRGNGHAKSCLSCAKTFADRINRMGKYEGKDIEGKLNLLLFPNPFAAPGWTSDAKFDSDYWHQVDRNRGFRQDTDYQQLSEDELSNQMDWIQLRGMYWRAGFTETQDDFLNALRSKRSIDRNLYSMIYPNTYFSE